MRVYCLILRIASAMNISVMPGSSVMFMKTRPWNNRHDWQRYSKLRNKPSQRWNTATFRLKWFRTLTSMVLTFRRVDGAVFVPAVRKRSKPRWTPLVKRSTASNADRNSSFRGGILSWQRLAGWGRAKYKNEWDKSWDNSTSLIVFFICTHVLWW